MYADSHGGQFKESGHRIFMSTSALSRGILQQRRERSTVHFNGDTVNTELLFQTVHSVNQISVYAAVTNWCYQFGLTNEDKDQVATGVENGIFNHGGTRRSGNVGISSEPCTWKQDAG